MSSDAIGLLIIAIAVVATVSGFVWNSPARRTTESAAETRLRSVGASDHALPRLVPDDARDNSRHAELLGASNCPGGTRARMRPGGRQPSWSGTACFSPAAQVSVRLNPRSRQGVAVGRGGRQKRTLSRDRGQPPAALGVPAGRAVVGRRCAVEMPGGLGCGATASARLDPLLLPRPGPGRGC